MPAIKNPRHEAFAQALARGLSIAAAYTEAGYKPNRGNAHTLLKQNKCISKRVEEIQAEQLAIHQQATAEAAANAKVTIESLIAEAEAARAKAMSEKGGAAAAVSAHDRQSQTGRYVAREGRSAQHRLNPVRTHRACHCRAHLRRCSAVVIRRHSPQRSHD